MRTMYGVEVELNKRSGKSPTSPFRRVRVWGKGEQELLPERLSAEQRFHEAQFQLSQGLPIEGIALDKMRAVRLVEVKVHDTVMGPREKSVVELDRFGAPPQGLQGAGDGPYVKREGPHVRRDVVPRKGAA